jgi:hypothetical protein
MLVNAMNGDKIMISIFKMRVEVRGICTVNCCFICE